MGLFLRPATVRHVRTHIFVVLAAALTAVASAAKETPRFDHPFAATTDRSFANVEEWRKVFDDPARDQWQRPQDVVAALAIEPGSVVVDLGAGTGYFMTYLSRAVGPNGSVLAVETEPNMTVALRERAEREKCRNVTPVLASANDPRIPHGFADRVLIVDTFHHIDDRLDYFRSLRESLRPQARIAVVDWKKVPLPVGPPLEHKVAREQVLYEMKAAGYRLEAEPTFLPYQYFLVFSPATD